MAFQIVKTFTVKAPPDAVWKFMVDVHRVARCMPGAAITDQVDDKTFTGTMTVKVGPVTTSYKGKVVFQKLDAEAHVAEIVASGQDIKGKGGANMKLNSTLKEIGPGETEVTAASDLSITGILAQMGRGMIQDVSDELFQIFSQRARTEIESESGAAGASANPPEAAADAAAAGRGRVEAPRRATSAADTRPGEALDLGSIGARAAGRAALRAMSSPIFWIVAALVVGLVYLLFIR